MRDLLADLRYASRVLRSAPLAATVAILSLGMAVAGTISVVAVIDAVVWRTLPVHEPHRLVTVWTESPDGTRRDLSAPMFEAFAADQRVFSHTTGWVGDLVLNVDAGGQMGLANVWAVTDDFFETLGEPAAHGRAIERPEAAASGVDPPDVVVLGDRLWRERFGSDSTVIGQTIRIEGVSFTVIGVSRPTFSGLSLGIGTDATVPLAALPRLREALGLSTNILTDPRFEGLAAGGRLAEGVHIEAACAQLAAWWPTMLRETVPAAADPAGNAVPSSQVRCASAAYGVNGDEREAVVRPFYVILALAAVVVGIGALHVALLLQQLMAHRTHELAVRLALGASRWRLLRLVLALGALVALAGVATGTAFSHWGSRVVLAGIAERGFLPVIVDVGVTTPVLAVVATLAVLLTLLCSAGSCLFVLRHRSASLVTASTARTTARIGMATSVLLVGQISTTLALVIAASTLHQTITAWTTAADGLQPQRLLMSRLVPQPGAYATLDDNSYYRALLETVTAMPGVVAGGLSIYEPGGAWQYDTRVARPGQATPPQQAVLAWVSPGFLDAVGVQMRQGRDVLWTDTRATTRVAVVSASLAHAVFPEGDALGRYIQVRDEAAPSAVQIVGIVPDARVFDLRQAPQPTVYLPWLQAPSAYVHWAGHLAVRYRGDQRPVVDGVREAVSALGHEYVIWTRPAADVAAQAMATERLARTLASVYAGLTVLLTMMGVFAALALVTSGRTREFAIRLALGAQRGQVVRLVLTQTLGVLVAGLLVGLPVALAFDRGLRSLIVGLAEPSLRSALVAVATAVAVCGAAAYLPARWAARTAPAEALRLHE